MDDGQCVLTLETRISAKFDVRRNVVPPWRVRQAHYGRITSMPNSLEKSCLVCVLHLFCTFLDKNEKNNPSPRWGRDEGILSSCPRYATSMTWQASSWIENLGHFDGNPLSLPQCGVRFYYFSKCNYHIPPSEVAETLSCL